MRGPPGLHWRAVTKRKDKGEHDTGRIGHKRRHPSRIMQWWPRCSSSLPFVMHEHASPSSCIVRHHGIMIMISISIGIINPCRHECRHVNRHLHKHEYRQVYGHLCTPCALIDRYRRCKSPWTAEDYDIFWRLFGACRRRMPRARSIRRVASERPRNPNRSSPRRSPSACPKKSPKRVNLRVLCMCSGPCIEKGMAMCIDMRIHACIDMCSAK